MSNYRLPDQLESWESAAEQRYDEMTSGVPKGHYKCACGRTTPDSEQNFLSPNPYSEPSCGVCFEEFMAEVKRHDLVD